MMRMAVSPVHFLRKQARMQKHRERKARKRTRTRRNARRDSTVFGALVRLGYIEEHGDENGPYWVVTEKGREAAGWLDLGSW